MQLQGTVEPGFEPVEAAFRENFERRGELGASFCVYHRGRKVVDLWGGLADRAEQRPWEADTLCVMFSATKGLVATCFLMASEQGLIDYDAPMAKYWPELGTGAKAAITVREFLAHRSGLVAIDQPLSLDDLADREKLVKALEAQEPLWEPGKGQGYHGVSFGPYASELFHRAVGKSVGRFLSEEIARPLDADVHLGLPEKHDDRVATLYPVSAGQRIMKALPYVMFNRVVERKLLRALMDKSSTTARAFAVPAELGAKGLHNFNLQKVRRLELAWANGIGSARGLARVYAALSQGGRLGGVTLCKPETVAQVYERPTFEVADRVIHKPVGWNLGFIKEEPHLFSPNPEAFGHPGAGGALGFCDPKAGLAWGYVMNRMDFRLRSPRALALSHALYECEPVRAV